MSFTKRRSFLSTFALWLSLGSLLLNATFVSAQETDGVVRCSDYFAGGSVQVDVYPYFNEVYTNNSILFGGKIKNDNSFPIVDGQVWMKVYRTDQTNAEQRSLNYYPVVDFILVKDNIELSPNSEETLEFEWAAPQYLAAGDYMSSFFFTTSDRYNLLGLTYADHAVGNTADFKVNNLYKYTPVVFDKGSVMINNTQFNFNSPPNIFEAEQSLAAYATLVNEAENDRMVEVTWTTYEQDIVSEETKVDTKTETVLVPAGGDRLVVYDIPTLDSTATFVVAEAKDADAKSILNIRFERQGLEESRLKLPTVLNYPIKAGEEFSVFSCVESANALEISGNTLTLDLEDINGNTIHSYTYEGNIDLWGMALKDSFVPNKDYGSFLLTATLSRAGETLETATLSYDCKQIDSSACTGNDETKMASDETGFGDKFPMAVILVIILVVLVTVLLAIYRLRSKTPEADEDMDVDEATDEYNPDNQ